MSHVWYVSYGSNMSADRLACYIEGGRPPGGSRANPGARDRTLPTRTVPVDLPGRLSVFGTTRLTNSRPSREAMPWRLTKSGPLVEHTTLKAQNVRRRRITRSSYMAASGWGRRT